MLHKKVKLGEMGNVSLLLVLVVFVVLALGGLYYLVSKNIIPTSSVTESERPFNVQTALNVSPEPTYQNPIDASSQYTNPFASYKNPFDSIQ